MIPTPGSLFAAAAHFKAGVVSQDALDATADLLCELGDQIADGRTDVAIAVLELAGDIAVAVLGAGLTGVEAAG